MPVIGILIGGESSRMGRPKAIITVDDTTLIERTAAVAATVSKTVLLLGEPPFALPRAVSSLEVIEDLHQGIGPMAGLESLLVARPSEACILLACDMPHVTSSVLKRLCDVPTGYDAAVVCTGRDTRHWHPCCAAYGPSVAPVVRAAVAAGRYGMIKLLGSLRVQPIKLAGDDASCVENWNEPEDLPESARADDRP